MKAINNFFVYDSEEKAFAIVTDGITGTFGNTYLVGQWIVIKDSVLNDGIYKITAVESNKLTLDATLLAEDTGELITVGASRVPADFINFASEITSWQTKNSGVEGISSEKIDDYAVSFDTSNGTGWKQAFSSRLQTYSKMYSYFDKADAPRERIYRGRCW